VLEREAMPVEDITCRPIGVIRSPHTEKKDTPIQPVFAKGVAGQVEVLPQYEEGLRDIEGFSHIYLLYAFDRADGTRLSVVPYLGDTERGVFATRAPCRPNALGMSLVRLLRREGTVLDIEDVDVLDGTPLLDIKPYIGRYDSRDDARSGWQEDVDDDTARELGRRGFKRGG
jgi:tRNA-Thr(GGU) m(6)t(6)A37 methyltransferase TsaA